MFLSSNHMPLQLQPPFLHFLCDFPTFVVPVKLSFLINVLSRFVTPHIHRCILICATSNSFSCAFFNAREVYHINRLKEMIGRDMCSQLVFTHAITVSEKTSRIVGVDKRLLPGCLQKENMFFDLVSTHSLSRAIQHRLSNESNNGFALWRTEHKFPCDNAT